MTVTESSTGNEVVGFAEDDNIYRFTTSGEPLNLGLF